MDTTVKAKKERFHFLDGLRGIAALTIVIHHSITAAVVKYMEAHHLGWLGGLISDITQSGVELFFVLSGVVLLRPYVRGKRKFEVGDYFVRRAKRLFPPYLAALLFGWLVIVVIKNGPHTYYSDVWKWSDTGLYNLAKHLLIVNFWGSSYYNLAWWSLGVEVIFYLLVPAFIFLFMGNSPLNYIKISITIAITILATLALQFYLTAHYPRIYSNEKVSLMAYRFIDYPVCFLMGVLLAKYDFKKEAGTIFMIIGGIIILVSHSYPPMMNNGFGLLYAGLLIHAFLNQKLRSKLDTPLMIWIGERSFSLFLVHFSCFYIVNYTCSLFFGERSIFYFILSRSIGIPLAIVAAILLFHFVERKQAKGLVTDKIMWPWQINRLKKEAIEE